MALTCGFVKCVDGHNDRNGAWQDGAVIVDFGEPQAADPGR
jgi:uncharacterized protein YukJ